MNLSFLQVAGALRFPPVVLITPWYGLNGVGLVVEGVAQSTRRLGGTCVVLHLVGDGWIPTLSRGSGGELIISVCARAAAPGAPMLKRIAARLRRLTVASLVRYLARRFDIRVAHFHYDMPEYQTLHRICRDAGLQCVATFHGSDLTVNMTSTETREVTAIRLRDCPVITTVSHALQQTLIGIFPDIAPRSRTVYNAIPVDVMEDCHALTATSRDVDVLFVGALIPRKGVDVLIRAISCIHDLMPALQVVIVGDGPDRDLLVALTSQLGLLGVIKFAGPKTRTEIVSLYRRARVLAVPSRAEPFGLVVVEGQMLGAVVVASAVGGIPEIIADCQTGLLVEPDNPALLGAAIASALADEQWRGSIATTARDAALANFSPARMALNYRDCYLTSLSSSIR